MKTQKHKNTVALHGEAMIMSIESIPDSAKRMKLPAKRKYLVIADSEVTGNHHVVDSIPGVKFWKDNDRRFMTVEEGAEATVRCLVKERHDDIKLAPGQYEFGVQQEYDYATENHRRVAD